MIARKRGAIVNMSSLAAHNGGGPGAFAYAMSKARSSASPRRMAKELAPHGIRVNCVAPGLIGETAFHGRFTAPDAFTTIAKASRSAAPARRRKWRAWSRSSPATPALPRRRNDRDQRRRLVHVAGRARRRCHRVGVSCRTCAGGSSAWSFSRRSSTISTARRSRCSRRSSPRTSASRISSSRRSARGSCSPTRSARRFPGGSTTASARARLHGLDRRLVGRRPAPRDARRPVGGLSCVPLRAGAWRGGQLAGRGEDRGRMVPRARARLRDGDLQQRRRARRGDLAADHRLAAAALRLAGGVPRHGRPRLPRGSCCGCSSTIRPTPSVDDAGGARAASPADAPARARGRRARWRPAGARCSAIGRCGRSSLARFMTDPIWWLYITWLPQYLSDARGFSLAADRPVRVGALSSPRMPAA